MEKVGFWLVDATIGIKADSCRRNTITEMRMKLPRPARAHDAAGVDASNTTSSDRYHMRVGVVVRDASVQ